MSISENTATPIFLVSIITPVYNSEAYVSETIKSVQRQTYSNWELILIDDFSSDHSTELAKTAAKNDPRIRYVRHDINKGVAVARNTGISMAKGQFIAFLDSDDLWDEGKLDSQINFMIQNNISLSYTAYRKIDTKGAVVTKKIEVSEKRLIYEDLLKHNEIGCLTAIYDCTRLGKRYFMKTGHEDYVYWLNILKSDAFCLGINTVFASYRMHSGSISSNKFKAASYTWNIYRNVEKLPLHRCMYYFCSYCIQAINKYLK